MDYNLRLVATDCVMPSQFFSAATESNHFWSSERRLMYACLQDAIHQVSTGHSGSIRQQRLATESAMWIFNDDASWPFAFIPICHHLHIEPSRLRALVKQIQTGRTIHKPRATPRVKQEHTHGKNP